jgi:hypothetical protein
MLSCYTSERGTHLMNYDSSPADFYALAILVINHAVIALEYE